jgi:hypothetical protein
MESACAKTRTISFQEQLFQAGNRIVARVFAVARGGEYCIT